MQITDLTVHLVQCIRKAPMYTQGLSVLISVRLVLDSTTRKRGLNHLHAGSLLKIETSACAKKVRLDQIAC